jgi:hypothetical protein
MTMEVGQVLHFFQPQQQSFLPTVTSALQVARTTTARRADNCHIEGWWCVPHSASVPHRPIVVARLKTENSRGAVHVSKNLKK